MDCYLVPWFILVLTSRIIPVSFRAAVFSHGSPDLTAVFSTFVVVVAAVPRVLSAVFSHGSLDLTAVIPTFVVVFVAAAAPRALGLGRVLCTVPCIRAHSSFS